MKKLFVAISLLLLSGYLMAQARDGSAEFKNTHTERPTAILIYLPYAPEVVKQALINYLSKTAAKELGDADNFQLSSNTLLVNNNTSDADIVLKIGLKDNTYLNESVIYLKLNSSIPDRFNIGIIPIYFDMKQAIAYLDNLAIAIKPYATDLQLKLQGKNLAKALVKSQSLIQKGMRFEEKRIGIEQGITDEKGLKTGRGLARRKLNNKQDIDDNLIAQANQLKEVDNQKVSLGLLTDHNKNIMP